MDGKRSDGVLNMATSTRVSAILCLYCAISQYWALEMYFNKLNKLTYSCNVYDRQRQKLYIFKKVFYTLS